MNAALFQPLTLGTVQLGMSYGIANANGQPDMVQAREILETAVAGGVAYLDTAPGYGTSEAVIGELCPLVDAGHRLRLVSKIAARQTTDRWLPELDASLRRLRCKSLDSWLLHDENDIAHVDPGMINDVRQSGRIHSFGVSCYSPEIATQALHQPVVTALQVPANVFDRRFLEEPVLNLLRDRNALLFVRSVFLQGLCLMSPADAPAHVNQAREAVATLAGFCVEHGLTSQAFCLHYINHRLRGHRHSIIVGIERAEQLRQLIAITQTPAPAPEVFVAWDERWPQSPPQLINPALWNPS